MPKPGARKRPPEGPAGMVKTTLRFEVELWKAASHLAVERSPDEGGKMVSFQDIVNDALRAYLQAAKPRKEVRP